MNNQANLTVTGIDLGSSAVKIAAILKGGVQVITNEANFRQTPNVVGFGEKQRLIGQSGQTKIKSNHANTVVAPSRFLGFNHSSPYLSEQLKFSPARLNKMQNQETALKFNLLHGQQRQSFTTEQLVAAYLTQIQKIIAQTNQLSNKNMVISVPSYFTQHQRKALLDAVEITKKKIKCEYSTQLVNQQISISMDYGYSKRNEFSEDLQKAHKVLFIDFGHSKTSAFVTAFNKQHMRVLANKFERQLGCKFMDQQLLNFYAKKFDESHPHMQLNLLQSKKSVLKLLENIERQRKVLSGIFEHELSIQCLLEDEDIFYSMKRDEYQMMCAPVIQKFKGLLTDFAEELKQKGMKFDNIELIGGGTRIPAIINAISQVFGIEPSRTINSNECVARGAALISAINSSVFRVQPYSFFNLCPYTVSLKLNNLKLDKKLVQSNELLVKQKSIELQIDESAKEFTLLAEYENIQTGLEARIFQCKVQIQRKQNKNSQKETEMKQQFDDQSKVKLSLSWFLNQNGLIVLDKISSSDSSLVIKVVNINYFQKFTTEQLNQMEQRQKIMTIEDIKIKKFYEKKNQYESLIYKNKHKIEQFISENNEYISEQKRNQAKEMIQAEENLLNSQMESNDNMKIQDFKKRVNQMNKKIEQLLGLVTQLKQAHQLVNAQLQKLANFLNQIISNRGKGMYPDQVNKVGEWVNGILQGQKSSLKYNPPIVTVQELTQTYKNIVQKINEFDQQAQRQRHMNLRPRPGQQRHQGYGRQPPSNYNPYHGYTGRPSHDQDYRPRTTRNNKNDYNGSSFGDFFGGSRFF